MGYIGKSPTSSDLGGGIRELRSQEQGMYIQTEG